MTLALCIIATIAIIGAAAVVIGCGWMCNRNQDESDIDWSIW